MSRADEADPNHGDLDSRVFSNESHGKLNIRNKSRRRTAGIIGWAKSYSTWALSLFNESTASGNVFAGLSDCTATSTLLSCPNQPCAILILSLTLGER